MNRDQHTALYGVIGNPVRHSLSPTLHNAAFSVRGINAVYLAFEPSDMASWVQAMRTLDIRGASVTIPFKTSVIPYLSEIDPLARRIGAVNTIVNADGRLTGYNTDAIGALKALEEVIEVTGKRCILLGAGGAACAIGLILREKGVAVSIVNRSRDCGERLAHYLGAQFISLEAIDALEADILIHTTPVGMWPHADQCLVPENILKEGMVVMDIIYRPVATRLLRMATARGCTAISGIPMLLHQAAAQFRLWTGIEPPLSHMKRAVKEALEEDDLD